MSIAVELEVMNPFHGFFINKLTKDIMEKISFWHRLKMLFNKGELTNYINIEVRIRQNLKIESLQKSVQYLKDNSEFEGFYLSNKKVFRTSGTLSDDFHLKMLKQEISRGFVDKLIAQGFIKFRNEAVIEEGNWPKGYRELTADFTIYKRKNKES